MKTTRTTLAFFIFGVSLAINGHCQSFLTNGLVAYFPFNGNANDASGNGHNATEYGAVLTTDRFSNANAAYHFSGGQYIDIPLDCSSQKPLTYSLWINQDTVAQWPAQSLIWTGTFDAGGHDVGILNTMNNLYFHIPPRQTHFSDFIVNPENWLHVVATYSDRARLYANGKMIADAEYTGAPIFRSSITRLGRSQDFYVNGFEGVIDDVRIYTRELSSGEVEQLFALESGPRVELIKAVKPSFSALWIGTNYQMQLSADMNTWISHGAPFTATNNTMIFPQYWDVENWDKLFFRLKIAP